MNVLLKKGFTLVELLVVIAIIGILSVVVTASLSTTRDRALDSQRISMLQSMRSTMSEEQTNRGVFPAISSVDNDNYAEISSSVGMSPGSFQVSSSSDAVSNEYCISYRLILPENPPTVYYVVDQEGARPSSMGC